MKQYNGVDIRDKIIHLVYTTHVFVNPVSENVSDYELKFDFPLVKKKKFDFPCCFLETQYNRVYNGKSPLWLSKMDQSV